jgi:cytochrome c
MHIALKRFAVLMVLGAVCLVVAGGAAAVGLPWPAPSGGPVTGETLYKSRCGGCHALDHNKYGPSHSGLWNRAAGAQPGYRYSAALAHSGLVWNAETLDTWLADPRRMVPGTRMDAKVDDPEQRRLIIAYVRSRTSPTGP